ncbi:HK97 family phage prohead protease [Amycolatopsis tolypomycina]|uniref:HK97 family phage prohead protease n=1 Tax=Amycolatopsis tolypomycina TaxID=208445 RepID=UPI0033B6DE63
MTKRVHLRGYVERADMPADGPIPFVLATEGRKADGIDLQMSAADLERFMSNPLLGYGHNYWGRDSLPIGRVDDPRVDGKALRGALVFDQDDDFAVKVERKIRNGFLNAVSVGFDAYDVNSDGVPNRWTLFEVSVVPLPMDPDAVAEGRELTRSDGPLAAIVERLAALEQAVRGTAAAAPPAAPGRADLDLRRRRLLLADRGY